MRLTHLNQMLLDIMTESYKISFSLLVLLLRVFVFSEDNKELKDSNIVTDVMIILLDILSYHV